MDRRDFLKASALASASSLLIHNQASAQLIRPQLIVIRTRASNSVKARLATRELLTGLRMLNVASEVRETTGGAPENGILLTLVVDDSLFKGPQEYEIAVAGQGAALRAASEQALLFAVFDFLERQGIVFGIDGTTVPIDPLLSLRLPTEGQPWKASPRFAVRGLLPWPDFLNCISVYNEEDFKAYFAAMLRMRFNMFGMHVYTQNDPLAESYLSFDFAGVGHRAALEDTTMRSWGYLPQRTSTYKMGAMQFFDQETFGSDATRLAADNWDIAARTTAMLRSALEYAGEIGIQTGIGFEPYKSPTEIIQALPPEALSHPGGFIESRTARSLLERRLADLLERYPSVDYVWLWEDEDASWESRRKNIPLSITPFVQAHEFLQRHAPKKKLVLAGWGGVTRNFESLHQRLPEDIIFSALSNTMGWDPIDDAFGKLGARERWPIPWLEDDPSMWFPQFRASRFQTDMQSAADFGCQGIMGIHWRHRIVDPTASYLARASWDRQLTASSHYRSFCAAMASDKRASRLANLFDACDSGDAISSTFLGTRGSQGFADRIELTGDYSDAFHYADSEPEPALLPKQRATAEQFYQLAAEATTPLERDRIGYFAGFVGLMVPYCDAYIAAHKLSGVLKDAVALRAEGKTDEARARVLKEGVPLWLTMAPLVRQTMLRYQVVIATRNDQGQLASMQNKLVRISLERLRLSIQEFLGELPPEMEQAYAAAISPESANPARIFMPTRPSLLKSGEASRIFLVVPGAEKTGEVLLHTRRQGAAHWDVVAARHAGRGVYTAVLGPFRADEGMVEYYAAATAQSRPLSDPPQAPGNFYTLSIFA